MSDENNNAATWAGLDVSKDTFDAAVHPPLTGGSPPPALQDFPHKSFPRTKRGAGSFVRWMRRMAERHAVTAGAPPLRCVMEATGRYSLELAAWLAAADSGLMPAVEDPKTVKDFARSLRVRSKTDKLDAAVLARYGVERNPVPQPDIPSGYRELRELSRERGHVRDTLTAARLRLAEIPDGSVARRVQERMVESLRECMRDIDAGIEAHVGNDADIRKAVRRLITIPGVGFITAVAVLAEAGPLTRFGRSRRLVSYAGLDPVLRQSGSSVRGGTRISKRGPAAIRRALFMASLKAMETVPELDTARFDLIRRGKPPMSARCAVMRRLLTIMHSVVVNDRDFIHNYGSRTAA